MSRMCQGKHRTWWAIGKEMEADDHGVAIVIDPNGKGRRARSVRSVIKDGGQQHARLQRSPWSVLCLHSTCCMQWHA